MHTDNGENGHRNPGRTRNDPLRWRSATEDTGKAYYHKATSTLDIETKNPPGSSPSLMLKFLAYYGGDAVGAHGDAIERVGNAHRALLVCDDDELGVLT